MTDEFLIPNAGIKRLIEEYLGYSRLIVAVDFDNTLYDYHKKGYTYEKAKQLVRDLSSIGCKIQIWTGNVNEELVASYLDTHDVPYTSINTDSSESIIFYKNLGVHNPPRKLFANVYLDDRAGIEQVYKDLELLVWLVKKNLI